MAAPELSGSQDTALSSLGMPKEHMSLRKELSKYSNVPPAAELQGSALRSKRAQRSQHICVKPLVAILIIKNFQVISNTFLLYLIKTDE